MLHGNVGRIHRVGVDVNGTARQHQIVLGIDIEVVELTGGPVGCHQENVVGHSPLSAAGGLVDGRGAAGSVGFGDRQGGGTAAVQAEGIGTAQLNEPRRHLIHGCADGMALAAAIHGIEQQRAVGALTHCRPGCLSLDVRGCFFAVLHQRIEGADGEVHVVPPLVRGGDGDGDGTAHRNPPQSGHQSGIGLQIGGEHNLPRLNGGGRAVGQNPLHPQMHGGADGQLAVRDVTDHIHARLGCAVGVASDKVIGVEEQAALGDPCLVDTGNTPGPRRVRRLIAQVGGDVQLGLAQNGRAVRPEPDAVAPGVTAHQLAVLHAQADGHAVAGVVEVAVDAGHHPVALALQLGRHGRDGIAGGQDVAVGHNGPHLVVGSICHQILGTII